VQKDHGRKWTTGAKWPEAKIGIEKSIKKGIGIPKTIDKYGYVGYNTMNTDVVAKLRCYNEGGTQYG